jgi:hypothetical protein
MKKILFALAIAVFSSSALLAVITPAEKAKLLRTYSQFTLDMCKQNCAYSSSGHDCTEAGSSSCVGMFSRELGRPVKPDEIANMK